MVATTYLKCDNPACDLQAAEEEHQTSTSQEKCEMTERCVNACAAYGRVCPCAARAAGRAACSALQKLSENSSIFHGKPDFTKLNCDDLFIKQKLGEGGFSVAHECVVQTGEEQGQTFAVKYLKRKAMVNQHTFELGAADLAVEAYFLATLDHPNVVSLHGVTAGSVETNVATGKECGFFIVVDRLHDTLEQRIEKLGKEQREAYDAAGLLGRRSHEFKSKRRAALNDRLKYALQVADAMKYMHDQKIIFRDLKPDNIGFDDDGCIKLFDFGLAKELKEESKQADGKYRMTGNTGSRRYMAPENRGNSHAEPPSQVALEKHYDLSVDVFSFGILLWELCALEKPYFGYSAGKHMQQVVMGDERPRLDAPNTSYFPVNLHWLLKKCWAPKPDNRPDFEQVQACLKDIIEGRDEIPGHHNKTTEDKPVVAPPAGGFSSLKKLPRRRFRTAGTETSEGPVGHEPTLPPPKNGFKSIPKPGGNKRHSTWTFGFRKSHN